MLRTSAASSRTNDHIQDKLPKRPKIGHCGRYSTSEASSTTDAAPNNSKTVKNRSNLAQPRVLHTTHSQLENRKNRGKEEITHHNGGAHAFRARETSTSSWRTEKNTTSNFSHRR
jgi:hypothetical protein